jgi:hypothetical protein
VKKNFYVWLSLALLVIAALIIIPKMHSDDLKQNFRLNPKSYVSIVSNGFKYNSLFGGISDCKVTVVNNSDFMLDHVRVVVTYIRKNGNKYKDELVDADHIPAHGQVTLSAPNSNAGMSIDLSVYSITCAEAGVY